MSFYPLYSDEAATTALQLIGDEYMGQTEVQLWRQIVLAVCGGDVNNALSVLEATGVGQQEVQLMNQVLVGYAT